MTAATCHPDRKCYAKDLCKRCYDRKRHHNKWQSSAEHQQRKKAAYKHWKQENRDKHIKQVFSYNRTLIVRYRRLREEAKRRNIECAITFKEYSKAVEPECFYCDGFFGRSEAGGGLDRLDNSKGYILGNVVSCCTTCNMTKGSHFTSEETRAAIQVVISMRRALKLVG